MHLAMKVLRLSFAGRWNGLENDYDQDIIYLDNYLNILYTIRYENVRDFHGFRILLKMEGIDSD